MSNHNDATVLLQEVSTRDGLQNEPSILSAPQRIEIINALVKAGLRRIQIGAFVNPRFVPQMADSNRVWQGLDHNSKNVLYTVLVLNERGLKTALDLKLDHIEMYVSASETHSLKNSRMGLDQSLYNAKKIIRRAKEAGIGITGGIMCAFGCYFEGTVQQHKVCEMASDLLDAGATEIGLADTTGMAKPETVKTLITEISKITTVKMIGLHLHDTLGYGLANLEAGLESGVRRFDSSVGGIGGCPFIPGASGNIATDKVVRLIEGLGYKTGVDLEKLDLAESILKGFLETSQVRSSGRG